MEYENNTEKSGIGNTASYSAPDSTCHCTETMTDWSELATSYQNDILQP
jgi:hypothetical protein